MNICAIVRLSSKNTQHCTMKDRENIGGRRKSFSFKVRYVSVIMVRQVEQEENIPRYL
jgi:hypothetical protein